MKQERTDTELFPVRKEIHVVNFNGEHLFETESGIRFDELDAENGLLNGSIKIYRDGKLVGQTTGIRNRGTLLEYTSVEGLEEYLPEGYETTSVLWPEWFQENDLIVAEGLPTRDESIRADEDWAFENLDNWLVGQALGLAAKDEIYRQGKGEEYEQFLNNDMASYAKLKRETKDELAPTFKPPGVIRVRRR